MGLDKAIVTSRNPEYDRDKWSDGPWDLEPDRVYWVNAFGQACLARRQNLGAWCGYVAVDPGHPWHGKYNELPDINVHGGITHAELCQGDICHVPAEGKPDNVWWLGFDCAHSGDLIPWMHGREMADIREHAGLPEFFKHDIYRDLDYVVGQITDLAEQIRDAQAQ